MKRFAVPLLFLLLFACAEKYQPSAPFEGEGRTILLMHPTELNLKRFQYLTENGIFPLPDDYHAVGIYHRAAAYDYSLSYEFLKNERMTRVSLLGIEEELDPADLFGENALSDIFRDVFSRSEGVIFFGGPDIPPALYGENTNLLTVITDPHRHYLELSFLFHLLGGYQDESFTPLMEQNHFYNVLGICLGMQSMNVATGGTLYQDIPTELYGHTYVEDVFAMPGDYRHRNYNIHYRTDSDISAYSFHRIVTVPETIMEYMAGGNDATPHILSSHHQAAKDLGKGWKVTAWSTDSLIVEAIEHTRYPNVMGVQFHPEIIDLYSGKPLRQNPGDYFDLPFFQTYSGREGENFHLSFWQYMGAVYK